MVVATRGLRLPVLAGKQDIWDVYRREKQLGTGSFGTAYQAVSIQTGETRVVKAVGGPSKAF